MSLTDTLKNTLSVLTEGSLNRYRLDIPSCTALLDVEEFSGKEFMSELYCYTILFTSGDRKISSAQLLSKPATLTMGTGPLTGLMGHKVVHGVVTHFKRISGSNDQATYQIIIEPFLSLLGNQFRTHRFFVNKSVPEVVAEVLTEHGLKGWEYEFTLKADYPRREQINQYRESDLAFIERLLAEVGIFYFFTLQPDTQTEVVHFADKQSAWTFGKSLPLSSPSGMSDNAADSVWGVNVRQNVVERSVIASDYNHREAQNVLTSVPADMTRGDGDGVTYGEVYHYLPRHLERGDKITPSAETGNFWARLEHERFLSGQTTISGCSNDALLSPAQVLTISERVVPPTLPSETDNGIIIIRTGYMASRKDALIVMWEGMPYYENRCWRPAAKKRPVVSGTLTARVTSARDNDIYEGLSERLMACRQSVRSEKGNQADIHNLQAQLDTLQQDNALIQLDVDTRTVANVIADWTGVPLSSLMKDEQTELLNLEREIGKRVVGQDVALNAIAQRLRAAKIGLTSGRGPQGVFLLVGPSGTGKTETALTLADVLYGGEKSLITINLSEYQEPHTVSQLKGSPPGYVGYGQGGILTEAVRKRPYSVVLLDEVEKAHRDVMNLFYQVFDRGFMRDGEGREIDFRNTVILMTSNLGSDHLMQLLDEQPEATEGDLHELLRPILRDHFQPALLARFQTVIYRPLNETAMRTIVQMKVDQVSQRLHRHYGLKTEIDESLYDALTAACLLPDTGARNVDSLLNQQILPVLSQQLLTHMAAKQKPHSLILGWNDEEGIVLEFTHD